MLTNTDLTFCTKENEVLELVEWVGKQFYRKESHIPCCEMITKFAPSLNSQGPLAKLQRNTFNNKNGGQKVGISEHLFQTNSDHQEQNHVTKEHVKNLSAYHLGS